ncbi:MAG: TIGR04283 family arsenosugar biosynthesis glycosyltransferase [Parvularculaceae bacterium]
MISVVIPTLDAAARLPACLAALVPATLAGLVKEVIIADGGSSDATVMIGEEAGARIVVGAKGRGGQLALGAKAARASRLLFLHADTVLDQTWTDDVAPLLEDENRAGVFTLAFDAKGVAPRVVSWGAMARTRLLRAPYGDQGLFISRSLYDRLGGYKDAPLFEDVEFIDRLIRAVGGRGLVVFPSRAVTSADRYLKDGYAKRVFKNSLCLALYRAGVAPGKIAAFYQS